MSKSRETIEVGGVVLKRLTIEMAKGGLSRLGGNKEIRRGFVNDGSRNEFAVFNGETKDVYWLVGHRRGPGILYRGNGARFDLVMRVTSILGKDDKMILINEENGSFLEIGVRD